MPTFDEIVGTVAKRCNLSSDEAIDRIQQEVNERYRQITSTCGITTIAHRVATAQTTIGDRYVTFGPQPGLLGVQKLFSVFNTQLGVNPPWTLDLFSFDELRNQVEGTDPCQAYAVSDMGAKSVRIFISCTPSSVYELSADCLASVQNLQGADEPAFSETFHDILEFGAMAAEYDRMEKPGLAKKKEDQFKERLSELKLFIAMNGYSRIWQNKTGRGTLQVPLVQG